jgi:hypothetical protein
MLNLAISTINYLKNNSAVTSIVAPQAITTGPVDIVVEKQNQIIMPQIIVNDVSEVTNTVPLNTRESRVQISCWSRTSQLEALNIYEAVVQALDYQSNDTNSTHIFWQRVGGYSKSYDSRMRLWNVSADFLVWSQ